MRTSWHIGRRTHAHEAMALGDSQPGLRGTLWDSNVVCWFSSLQIMKISLTLVAFLPALLFVCTVSFNLKKTHRKKKLIRSLPSLNFSPYVFLKKNKTREKEGKKQGQRIEIWTLGKDESLLRLTMASFNEN